MAQIVDGIAAEFRRYKHLGEQALAQVDEADLARPGPGGGNSLATLVWHIAGNLRSRFQDFRTGDGEKPWRRRDEEFAERPVGRAEVMAKWESGWSVLFRELAALTDADLDAMVTIRAEPLRIDQALQRSVTHIAYHVGQVVYLAKALRGAERWNSLSIPVGMSDAVNRKMGYVVSPDQLAISAVSPASDEAQTLVEELLTDLCARYPMLSKDELRESTRQSPLTVFVVGWLGGEPVACGGLKPRADSIVEVKRMYVRPAARGRGFARQVLTALEQRARADGAMCVWVETGDKQPEAISLYKSAGYIDIPRYGEYVDMVHSRCFEKRLDNWDRV
jgi:GNAT superfamily N-acetyltransferase